MKVTMTLRHLIIPTFLFVIQLGFTQTQDERKEIISSYNIEYLNQLANQFSTEYHEDKRKALKYAHENGIEPVIELENGEVAILEKVLDDGTLFYVSTNNENSAITINSNNVKNGGDRNLNLNGSGIVMGIWDGGLVRLTHQELAGRVQQFDNPNGLSSHATHVGGTMIASGVNSSSQGMSSSATLRAYDFNNDTSEMANEAASGLLISNHSYGLVPGQLPDAFFGAYLNSTRNLDIITYNAPYYLPVFAAGNSRNNGPSSGGPHNPSKNGFDLISGKNLAKNILCVANTQSVLNYTGPSSVNVWSTSSFGPADDGRIKPDISAQGRNTFSSTANGDDTYSNFTGTSMAAPAISGSLGLLQQHHNNMYGFYLTASSMKALVLHTAREAGLFPGPDYQYGWGLMNTAAASDMITYKGFTNILEENTLNQGDTYSFTVETFDPTVPLVATITWTDPAGQIQNTNIADDPTPRLVNDLDIRVIDQNGNVTFPWKLSPVNPANPATQGDNIVDNIEKIEINNPSGTYTIEITHKGSLVNLEQDYSLIVSGILESEISIVSNERSASYCANESAIFEFNVSSVPSFNGLINLSITGLPSSFTPVFSPANLTNQGVVTLTISNLDSVSAGDYPFTVNATSGTFSNSFDMVLGVEEAGALADLNISGPDDDTTSLSPILEWIPVANATLYEVEIYSNSSFTFLIESGQTTDSQYQTQELDSDTMYFWRVRPVNECLTGSYALSTFTTKDLFCAPLFAAIDTPVIIPDDSEGTVQSSLLIPNTYSGFEVEDVNVHLDISHTWLEDLTVTLTSPNGTTITLIEDQCGQLNDANVIIDDKGGIATCNTTAPTLSGTIKGIQNLTAFNGETFNGIWTLSVSDNFDEDGGSINDFELEICYDEFLSTSSQYAPQFSMYPNPAKNIVNIDMSQNTSVLNSIEVFDISGRRVHLVEEFQNSQTLQLNVGDFTKGIYLVRLNANNAILTKKLIVK